MSYEVHLNGVIAIDHSRYMKDIKKLSLDQLRFRIKDAKEAIEAFPENPKAGYYSDEIHYCNMEIVRRNKG